MDVLCSRQLPRGTRRLVSVLKDALRQERLDPFYGGLTDQQGRTVYEEDDSLPSERLLTMFCMEGQVECSIPSPEVMSRQAMYLLG